MDSIVTLTMNPAVDTSTSTAHVFPDSKLRCQAPRRDPGGGGINVARAIRKLGGDSLSIYPAGGPTGQLLHDLLREEHVRQDALPVKAWTRENLYVHEDSSGHHYRFIMPGAALEESEWRHCLKRISQLPKKTRYLVASGSLPSGVPEDFFAQIAKLAKQQGIHFVLDTMQPALGRALKESVYLAKPSMDELSELTGLELRNEWDQAAAAQKLVNTGQCEVVVLSLGPAGAWLATKTGAERFWAPSVRPKSRVGAGDSMLAAIILVLSHGIDIQTAVRFGVAAGSAATLNPGTQLCRREDVERLFGGAVPGLPAQ